MLSAKKFLFSTLRVAVPIALSMFIERIAMAASAEVPILKVTAPNGVHLIPLATSENGFTSGTSTFDGDSISWVLDLANPAHQAYVNGFFSIQNNSDFQRAYALELIVPVGAPLANTIIGGSVLLGLTMDANGGSLKCAPNATDLLAHLHDGVPAAVPFDCPFGMGSSGEGTASNSSTYGDPIPSLPSSDIASQVRIRFQPLLTDGDTAKITITAVVDGDENSVTPPPPPTGGPDSGIGNPKVADPDGDESAATPTPTPAATTPPVDEPEDDNTQELAPPSVADPVEPAVPEGPVAETPLPVPTATDSESGSLAIERLKARAPKVKVRIVRDGVAATTYSTEISAAGRQRARAFDCIIGEIAPGASSVTATLRLHESVRGSLEVKARAISNSVELAASSSAKVKRLQTSRRMMMRMPSCPVKLLKAE